MVKTAWGTKRVLKVAVVRRLRRRKNPMPFSQIAKKYGVSRAAVYQFAWRHKIK